MYKLIYDNKTGQVSSIQNGNKSIPLADGNMDYYDFKLWNSKQAIPLDLNSTIEIMPPEKTVSVEEEVANLKAQVAILSKSVDKSGLTTEEVATLNGGMEVL